MYGGTCINVGCVAQLDRIRAVGEVLPTMAFYLQESVGGRLLPIDYWRQVADTESCIAVKTAPFDRYRTRDVVVAMLESDRWRDIALLTGNDDTIVWDLITPHRRIVGGELREVRCRGGLLGQWAVGTRAAAALVQRINAGPVDDDLLALATDVIEINAAVFDVANNFAGCVPGVNEVLRQQGFGGDALTLLEGERISAGQAELIQAARSRFGDLLDEEFVATNIDGWKS